MIKIMEQYIINRINLLQKELDDIKKIISEKKHCQKAKSLKGIWKNVVISDQDLLDAKKSLSKIL